MSDTPTTNEDYAKQEEARRQELIEQDIAMHEETDEPSPFPSEGQSPEDVKESKTNKKSAATKRPITRPS